MMQMASVASRFACHLQHCESANCTLIVCLTAFSGKEQYKDVEGGLVNMGLSEKQLAHLKHKLLEMKDELETKKRRTTGEMSDSRGDIARGADNHIGETASEYEDRVIQQSLNEADQKRLQDITEALERIEEGTYGICIDTGQPIPYERLEALPYAKRTPEAQREKETLLAEDRQEASGVDYVRMEGDTETTRALEQEQQASHQSGEDAFSHSTNEQDWPKQ